MKNIKKSISLVFSLIMVIALLSFPALARAAEPKVILDGAPIVFDQPPVINKGRVMVPLRGIFEALSAQLKWDGSTQTITAIKGATKIIVKIGSTKATVNGQTKTLDVPAQIIKNRTLVPLRFISESLGAKVTWSENSQTVTIFDLNVDLEKKAEEIIAKVIKPEMNDLQKELAIHNYIVKNTKYDIVNYQKKTIPLESFTAYGVLIKGIGVCEGYAEAANLLLNKAGIESKIATGIVPKNGGWEGHAWNIVKINGEYYHLDVTWDDSDNVSNTVTYGYFNITDDQISKSRKWDRGSVLKCTKEFSYYNILNPSIYENGIRTYISGAYLDVDSENIYFEEYNNGFNAQKHDIYKIEIKNNSKKEKLIEIDGYNMKINREGEWLYYIYNPFPSVDTIIKKSKIDGSQDEVVKVLNVNEGINNLYVKDGWIYIVFSGRIMKMNTDGSNVQDIVTAQQGEIITSGEFDGNWIYYSKAQITNAADGTCVTIDYKVNTEGTKNIRS